MIAREIIDAAVAGVSLKQIAVRQGCSQRDVSEVLNEYAAEQLSPANRAAAVVIEASRIDHLQRKFLRQAIEEGDVAAGTLCCKLGQRKAALWASTSQARCAWICPLRSSPIVRQAPKSLPA